MVTSMDESPISRTLEISTNWAVGGGGKEGAWQQPGCLPAACSHQRHGIIVATPFLG